MSQAIDYWHEGSLTLFSSGKNCISQIFVLRTQFSLSFISILVSCKEGLHSQSYGFSSSHVWMWKLNHKEGWVLKNWCFWTVVLKKSLLDCKNIKPVNLKGSQSWIFIRRTETPILWPPDVRSWLIRKDPDTGKDWRQEEKGMTESEIVVWHHWLHGHELEKFLGIVDGQGSLVCCNPWGCKESDTTEQLNHNNNKAGKRAKYRSLIIYTKM